MTPDQEEIRALRQRCQAHTRELEVMRASEHNEIHRLRKLLEQFAPATHNEG